MGRLAQGLKGRVKGTNTIYFINKNQVPKDRWKYVTYGCICANDRPEKEDPYRIWITIGGDRINYNEDCGTPTAYLLAVKLLLNIIFYTAGPKFFTMDIKNFYLNTPLPRYEYFRFKISDMPDDFIKSYVLYQKATKEGYLYVECRRGMYGLPYAGLIAQELPEKYWRSTVTPNAKWHQVYGLTSVVPSNSH